MSTTDLPARSQPGARPGVAFVEETLGSGLIEFALTVPVLLAVLFGIMECCIGLYVSHYVANAAHEGTRYAAVRGSSWVGNSCSNTTEVDCTATAADVTAYIQSLAPKGVNTSNLTVTTTWSGLTALGATCLAAGAANSPGCMVNVKVSYNFPFSVPFVPTSTWKLVNQSTLTIMQ